MMAPKKSRMNPRKINVPTGTPPECELEDTAVDTQRRTGEREDMPRLQRDEIEQEQQEKRQREETN